MRLAHEIDDIARKHVSCLTDCQKPDKIVCKIAHGFFRKGNEGTKTRMLILQRAGVWCKPAANARDNSLRSCPRDKRGTNWPR